MTRTDCPGGSILRCPSFVTLTEPQMRLRKQGAAFRCEWFRMVGEYTREARRYWVLPMVEVTLPVEIETIPNSPAVFLIWARAGRPYLARTNVLRRRVGRMLSVLGSTAERLEYQVAGSKLEARFLHLELARLHLGTDYRREIRLRLPPYLKLILSNEFPRTQIVGRLARASKSLYVG